MIKYFKDVVTGELFQNPIESNHSNLEEVAKEAFYAALEIKNNPTKTLELQTNLTKSECTRRIESQWDQVGQRNVSIGEIYTVKQETDCKNWIISNREALSTILGRTDILDIDVTDDQYWPVYSS